MKKSCLLLLILLLAVTLTACNSTESPNETTPVQTDEAADPVGESDYTGPDFFVAADGDDANDGSAEHPFASFARAQEAVRACRAAESETAVTVTFAEGRYPVAGVVLTAEDGGSESAPVTYRGDGEVVFDAGCTIPADRFSPVTDDAMLARFDETAADKILVCDLGESGVTAEDLGTLKGIGTYAGNAAMPQGMVGTNPSVFSGDTRLTLARYPNDAEDLDVIDELVIGEGDILDEGDKSGQGGTIRLPADAAERVAKWATIDGAWMFGYPMFDWADVSTPIDAFDPETGGMTFRYYTYGGYREGGSYYLYNVPEELDAPGEYWIDYDGLKLYYYPIDGAADGVMMTLGSAPQFSGTVSHITFDGITFVGSPSTVISLKGDFISVKNCTLKDADGYGINLTGYNETVFNSEICHVGRGGILINSGDKLTLTPGNSWVDNCYIHHYAEIYKTYQDGAWVSGVADKITHTEICYAPHSAICATGNDTLLEYNYVHDVVQKCSDGGAFYAGGRSWSAGNVIRYNKFENIGNEHFGGTAIYFDDGLCGYAAYGNVILNATGGCFLCGGGRDIQVYNNLGVGAEGRGETFICYDQRMITWYGMEDHPNVWDPEQNGWWKALQELPLDEGIWNEKYPQVAAIHFDTDRTDDPDFLCNPSGSVIKNNIWIGPEKRWTFAIEEGVLKYAEVGYNYIHHDLDRVFEPGTYELTKVASRDKELEWEPIPYDQFGRYEID